jgi:hypothetical protein
MWKWVKKVVAVVTGVVLALGFTHAAIATNESSYKYGYWWGFNNYNCVSEGCDVPDSYPPSTDTCEVGHHSVGITEVKGLVVTNTTACSHGYINGWKDWCKKDTSDCTANVLRGIFPDVNKVKSDDPYALPPINYTMGG